MAIICRELAFLYRYMRNTSDTFFETCTLVCKSPFNYILVNSSNGFLFEERVLPMAKSFSEADATKARPKKSKGRGLNWKKLEEERLTATKLKEERSSKPSATSATLKQTGEDPHDEIPRSVCFKSSFTPKEIDILRKMYEETTFPEDTKGKPPIAKDEYARLLNGIEFNGIPFQQIISGVLLFSKWLNDTIIERYNNILRKENQEHPGYPKCYWLMPNLYVLLTSNEERFDFDRVKGQMKKSVTKKLGSTNIVKEMDIIFVPLNLNKNKHWALGVINIKEKRFEQYDSLQSDDVSHLEKLSQFFIAACADKQVVMEPPPSEWKLLLHKDTPQQKNNFDCGVFMLMFSRCISRGQKVTTFTATQTILARQRIAVELYKDVEQENHNKSLYQDITKARLTSGENTPQKGTSDDEMKIDSNGTSSGKNTPNEGTSDNDGMGINSVGTSSGESTPQNGTNNNKMDIDSDGTSSAGTSNGENTPLKHIPETSDASRMSDDEDSLPDPQPPVRSERSSVFPPTNYPPVGVEDFKPRGDLILNIVSYNISWAIGEKKSQGSEQGFIDKFNCLENNKCRQNQMQSLKNLANKTHFIDVLCFQEYRQWNEDDKTKLYNKDEDAIEVKDIVGEKHNCMIKGEVFIAWNTDKLGKNKASNHTAFVQKTTATNIKQYYRDCLMILTDKGFVLINVHMPQDREEAQRQRKFLKFVNETLSNWKDEVQHIIVCGDFNDNIENKALLPMTIGKDEIYEFTLTQIDLITCCYDTRYGMHTDGKKKDEYKLKGDYIFSNMTSTKLKTFNYEGHINDTVDWTKIKENARSEHEPVFMQINLLTGAAFHYEWIYDSLHKSKKRLTNTCDLMFQHVFEKVYICKCCKKYFLYGHHNICNNKCEGKNKDPPLLQNVNRTTRAALIDPTAEADILPLRRFYIVETTNKMYVATGKYTENPAGRSDNSNVYIFKRQFSEQTSDPDGFTHKRLADITEENESTYTKNEFLDTCRKIDEKSPSLLTSFVTKHVYTTKTNTKNIELLFGRATEHVFQCIKRSSKVMSDGKIAIELDIFSPCKTVCSVVKHIYKELMKKYKGFKAKDEDYQKYLEEVKTKISEHKHESVTKLQAIIDDLLWNKLSIDKKTHTSSLTLLILKDKQINRGKTPNRYRQEFAYDFTDKQKQPDESTFFLQHFIDIAKLKTQTPQIANVKTTWNLWKNTVWNVAKKKFNYFNYLQFNFQCRLVHGRLRNINFITAHDESKILQSSTGLKMAIPLDSLKDSTKKSMTATEKFYKTIRQKYKSNESCFHWYQLNPAHVSPSLMISARERFRLIPNAIKNSLFFRVGLEDSLQHELYFLHNTEKQVYKYEGGRNESVEELRNEIKRTIEEAKEQKWLEIRVQVDWTSRKNKNKKFANFSVDSSEFGTWKPYSLKDKMHLFTENPIFDELIRSDTYDNRLIINPDLKYNDEKLKRKSVMKKHTLILGYLRELANIYHITDDDWIDRTLTLCLKFLPNDIDSECLADFIDFYRDMRPYYTLQNYDLQRSEPLIEYPRSPDIVDKIEESEELDIVEELEKYHEKGNNKKLDDPNLTAVLKNSSAKIINDVVLWILSHIDNTQQKKKNLLLKNILGKTSSQYSFVKTKDENYYFLEKKITSRFFYKCPTCSKTFRSQENIIKHHTIPGPYNTNCILQKSRLPHITKQPVYESAVATSEAFYNVYSKGNESGKNFKDFVDTKVKILTFLDEILSTPYTSPRQLYNTAGFLKQPLGELKCCMTPKPKDAGNNVESKISIKFNHLKTDMNITNETTVRDVIKTIKSNTMNMENTIAKELGNSNFVLRTSTFKCIKNIDQNLMSDLKLISGSCIYVILKKDLKKKKTTPLHALPVMLAQKYVKEGLAAFQELCDVEKYIFKTLLPSVAQNAQQPMVT